ncbi:CPBP family intramembrane metalloprotease [Rhodobacteraceae bacterium CCMM004]|nr:CPBP family intramembrane metalloprotease [Rhodobacteraceae bacterium CCMM004]
MTTPLFDRFVAPARAYPQIWRTLAGSVLIAATVIAWVLAGFAAVALARGTDAALAVADLLGTQDGPAGTLLLLATFVGMALGPILAASWLHRRGAGTLFGPAPRVLRDFVAAAAGVGAVYGVGVGLWALVYDAVPNLDPSLWLTLLAPALIGVAVQTLAEELVFRGYLMQQFAARFRSPLIWAVVPAVLFGAIHWDPTAAGDAAIWVVASATLFGLIAADLTMRTGSLGAAWGFHFVNNVVALLILGTEGSLTGLALYRTPYAITDADLLAVMVGFDMAMMILAWLLVRRLVAR